MWLGNIIRDHRRVPKALAGAYARFGVNMADLTPDRLEGDGGVSLRLTDEQILCDILDRYANSTYHWAKEIPYDPARDARNAKNRQRYAEQKARIKAATEALKLHTRYRR